MRPFRTSRLALLCVLQRGYSGTFDQLAEFAGVCERQAQQTLWNLRREGLVQARRPNCHISTQPQRARVIYSRLNPVDKPIDALRFTSVAWR